MFERFTERARKVVVLAQAESERLRHDYIGTEHLLLGLIREKEGVASQALYACGVTLEAAREGVEGIVGYGEGDATSQKPFTLRSKRVLQLSLREAQSLRRDFIGTEHLLLGLLVEGDGVPAAVLSGLGVETADVRREVFGRLGGGSRTGSQEDLGPLGWAREALRRSFGRYPRAEDRSTFGKFTERARRVVVLGQDEARLFNHNYIGTEHLLLGLIGDEEGVAAGALRELGVKLDEVREQVESIVGYGEERIGAQAPFTPRVSKVLQHALLEAEQLDHDYVGPEHVLLGLVREVEGVAARVLLNLDVDPDEIRREVIERLPDGEDGLDPLDDVEREMEGGRHRTLFRGHVGGIQTATERGPLILDVDYSYRLPVNPALSQASIDPQDVADVTRTRLDGARTETPEGAAEVAGTHLMETFRDLLEITVTVARRPEPSDPLAPTFSVSATFRR